MIPNKFTHIFLVGGCFFLLDVTANNNMPYADFFVSAAADGELDRVKLQLDLGKEAGLTRDIINQALLAASENGYPDIVKKLLEAGAIPNVLDENGMSALMMAAQEGHLNVLQVLLQHKAETELANKNGETVLLIAVSNGSFDMANELIQAGANVNHTSATGVTPLIIAAKKGYEALVNLLCKAGTTIPEAHVMIALPDAAQALIRKHCSWTDYLKSQWGAWKSFLGSPFASQQQEDATYEPIFEDEPTLDDDQGFKAELIDVERALEVLGLDQSEKNETAIKKAYKGLARMWHPDKAPAGNEVKRLENTKKFQEINNAYHALKKHLDF